MNKESNRHGVELAAVIAGGIHVEDDNEQELKQPSQDDRSETTGSVTEATHTSDPDHDASGSQNKATQGGSNTMNDELALKQSRFEVLEVCETLEVLTRPSSSEVTQQACNEDPDDIVLKQSRLEILELCETVLANDGREALSNSKDLKIPSKDGKEPSKAFVDLPISVSSAVPDKEGKDEEVEGETKALYGQQQQGKENEVVPLPTAGTLRRGVALSLASRPGAFSLRPSTSEVRARGDPDEDHSELEEESFHGHGHGHDGQGENDRPTTRGMENSAVTGTSLVHPNFHMDASLKVARPVIENTDLQTAEEINNRAHWDRSLSVEPDDDHWGDPVASKSEKIRRWLKYVAFAFIPVAILIICLVFLLPGETENQAVASSYEPTGAPTQLATLSMEERILSLLPEISLSKLSNSRSPQSKAFEWAMHDPNLNTYSNHRILQRFALATLFFSTNGDGWLRHDNWLSYNHHECDWEFQSTHGIYEIPETNTGDLYNATSNSTCGEEGESIIQIWLSGNNLQGQIPVEISMLSSLELLSLDRNELTGKIPSSVGQLDKIKGLALYSNEMSGSVPSQLGLLTNLVHVWLMSNELSGVIPSELGQLSSNLNTLLLDTNKFTGSLPSEIGNLKKVTWLWAFTNDHLTGPIPSEIANMQSLELLWFWGTGLSSTIPTEVGRLSNLTSIGIDFTDIDGTIPSELGLLTSVTLLHLGGPLVGTVPTELAQVQALESVTLYNSFITGPIPSEFGLLTNLWRLWGSNSLISGSIPTEMGSMDAMGTLNFERSHLSGSLPSELFQLTNLEQLYLFDNGITGKIPTEVGTLNLTSALVLHSNWLTGPIPSDLGMVTTLTNCNLGNNSLTGSVATELGQMIGMHELYLNDNFLVGALPSELGLLVNLTRLDVSDNTLTGTIPSSLESLELLEVMMISNNTLVGTVPEGLCELTSWDGRGIRIDCELVDCTCNECFCD